MGSSRPQTWVAACLCWHAGPKQLQPSKTGRAWTCTSELLSLRGGFQGEQINATLRSWMFVLTAFTARKSCGWVWLTTNCPFFLNILVFQRKLKVDYIVSGRSGVDLPEPVGFNETSTFCLRRVLLIPNTQTGSHKSTNTILSVCRSL